MNLYSCCWANYKRLIINQDEVTGIWSNYYDESLIRGLIEDSTIQNQSVGKYTLTGFSSRSQAGESSTILSCSAAYLLVRRGEIASSINISRQKIWGYCIKRQTPFFCLLLTPHLYMQLGYFGTTTSTGAYSHGVHLFEWVLWKQLSGWVLVFRR